jgi:hypothetical protein
MARWIGEIIPRSRTPSIKAEEPAITAREIAERRKLTPAPPNARRDRFPHRFRSGTGRGGQSALKAKAILPPRRGRASLRTL